jgi:tRNA (mo5U34)-methyltransferase
MLSLFENVYWHQRWEISPGFFTPGHNDIAAIMDRAQVPKDLTGKRVLDIGAWNGCVSFECERRGAAEVLAIGPEPSHLTGFDRLKEHLNSKVRYELGTIYHLDRSKLGAFEVTICFGVLYHLRHPLLGLDMMRRVCGGEVFLESAALDDDDRPLLQFHRRGELAGDDSNWFSFNRAALEAMLWSSGFEPLHTVLHQHRLSIRARVLAGKPEWMTIKSGEGVYYDTIAKPLFGSPDVY